MITSKDIGKRVKCLVGCKGYGEGILIKINNDEGAAYVRLTKESAVMGGRMRKVDREEKTCIPYVELA